MKRGSITLVLKRLFSGTYEGLCLPSFNDFLIDSLMLMMFWLSKLAFSFFLL